MSTKKPEYVAFVSYQRKDEQMAKWFHHQLEHYHLPTDFNDREAEFYDRGESDGKLGVLENLRPMFLDEAELAGGSLSGTIDSALNNSKFIIVLCSPNSAQSQWVNKEVQAFVDSGRVHHIIPVIIEGIPYSGDVETECFVPALLKLKGTKDERIGINAMSGREMASVKVVSHILGVSFDSLWNRYEREKEQERQRILEEKRRLQRLESRYLSEKSKDAIAEGNSYLARKLALRALPENIYNDADRPFVGEASDALYHSLFSDNASISKDIHGGVSCSVFCPYGALQYICPGNEQALYGKVFAACVAGGVAFWDASVGLKIKEIHFDTRFSHLSFSHDGKMMVLVAYGNICVYSLDQGWKREIEKDYSSLYDYAQFSNCGKYVACVYNHEYDVDDIPETYGVVLYDARTLAELKRFVGHGDRVTSLAFTPDSRCLFSCSHDCTIRFWDIGTGECLKVTDAKYKIKHIAINSDGTKLLAALNAKVILLWEIGSGKKPMVFRGHEHVVFYAGFSADEKMLISVSRDNTVKLWDISSGECLRTISSATYLRFAALSHNARYMVTGPGINITDLQGTDFLRIRSKNVETKKMGSPKIAFSANSKTLYYSTILREGDDFEICRWNLEENSVEKYTVKSQKPQPDPDDLPVFDVLKGSVRGLYVSPDDKYLIVDVDSDDIYVLEMPGGKVVKRITVKGNKYRIVVYGCCGQLFIWSSGELYSLNTNTLEYSWIMNTFEMRRAMLRAMWGNSEKLLFCYDAGEESEERHLLLYEYDILRKETVNKIHIPLRGSLKDYIFSADGKKLFIITDTSSGIWDIDSGGYISNLPNLDLSGDHIAFSPDSRFIISSQGKKISHWDVATCQCFYTQSLEVKNAGTVLFSPDRLRCASSSIEGVISVWDFVEPEGLINSVRGQYASCELSESEKKTYYLE